MNSTLRTIVYAALAVLCIYLAFRYLWPLILILVICFRGRHLAHAADGEEDRRGGAEADAGRSRQPVRRQSLYERQHGFRQRH